MTLNIGLDKCCCIFGRVSDSLHQLAFDSNIFDHFYKLKPSTNTPIVILAAFKAKDLKDMTRLQATPTTTYHHPDGELHFDDIYYYNDESTDNEKIKISALGGLGICPQGKNSTTGPMSKSCNSIVSMITSVRVMHILV